MLISISKDDIAVIMRALRAYKPKDETEATVASELASVAQDTLDDTTSKGYEIHGWSL